MKKKKEQKIKWIILGSILLFLLVCNYFVLLPLNLRYPQTFMLFIGLFLIIFFMFIDKKKLMKKTNITIEKQIVETTIPGVLLSYVLGGTALLLICYSLFSSPLFLAHEYKNLIGEVVEKDFITEFEMVENNELPIVDYTYASKLGDKKLGADRGLGSEFHVGEFTDITVNGEMKMVAPLEFNGVIKWLNNKSTPGYVIVDKITGDVELITEIDGKKLELTYLESAYLNYDLKRHVYMNGHVEDELYQFNFEIDDLGNPYYIVTKTHKTIGISAGTDVKSVVVVDIQSGEMKEYKPEDVPLWVDTVYPNELVLQQADYWGYYVNGFLNTMFGEKNIVRVTEGTRVVYNDGDLYHYTGMTSVGSDESTVGFIFINMRTKETVFYKMVGATEYSAMRSAEGKVENYGYTSSIPIPLNIEEEATFFMTLKDSSGLIKQYAFVNIEDFSIVGNGDTINEALNSYLKALNKEYLSNDKDAKEVSGTISRIGFDIIDGTTTYYFVLKEDNTLYTCLSSINPETNVTNIGDKVSIKVVGNKVIEFDNLGL